MSNSLKIRPPVYMIGMKIHCWRCQSRMPVIAILAPHIEDTENQIGILSEIESLPDDVIKYIQHRVPTYKLKYSKTLEHKYFANTCPKCRVISGDFYLNSEPGAPFFPTDEKEANELYLTEIPIDSQITVQASVNFGVGELIINNAKQIA
jgi:hypothetical protein